MGGLIFAATTAAQDLENSSWYQDNPWVGVLLGILVSGLVHSGKMAARPVVNLGTAGMGGPMISTLEDGASLGLSLIAILAPLLVTVALIALAWVFVRGLMLLRRRRRRTMSPEPRTLAP
jgi:hypothetical protein